MLSCEKFWNRNLRSRRNTATLARVAVLLEYRRTSGSERSKPVGARWSSTNLSFTASNVASLFFPRSAVMGLEPDYNLSPAALEKVVYAGVHANSFAQAAKDLDKLADLNVSQQRVRRATERIGRERVSQQQAQSLAHQELPLPEQQRSPAEQVPQVACVQMDGGRIQLRDRHAIVPSDGETRESFWRETKVGCLLSMTSQVSAVDPCPRLPASFVDPQRVSEIARGIKGVSAEPPTSQDKDEEIAASDCDRAGRPRPLVKSVVATSQSLHEFGPRLAAAAYWRGFAAAPRKAFVADGAEANWSVWRKFFSHYTPIVDFIHVLCYVYAAAMAGRQPSDGWNVYRRWAQSIWSGNVDQVIAGLQVCQQEIGMPEADEASTSPRQQVADTLRYLTNQRSRMRYDEYRRQGLPITSSAIESTVKQVSRRVKGTEKFWSTGAEAMLTLVADHLSETNTLRNYWQHRPTQLDGTRTYQLAV